LPDLMRALQIVSDRPVADVTPNALDDRPVVLRLRDVSKRFTTAVALDKFSLELRAGEFVALIGPSGAGKSTLFRCITQLEPPDEGQIEIDGRDVTLLTARELRDIRRTIGLVFQQFNLIGRLNALDNVLLGTLGSAPTWRVLSRRFAAADRQAALAALDHVGLLERAYQRADKLSGGQQQRVAIARVLAQGLREIIARPFCAACIKPISRGAMPIGLWGCATAGFASMRGRPILAKSAL
jgi:phosphonate transport system ATP-binding protein